jgi:ferredoxin
MCERGCRRASADGAVSIRSLHGYVADWDLCGEAPYTPLCAESTSKSVAVVGSGAAALAAAFELRRLGHAAVVYDPAQVPGGELRAQLDDQGVLDAEIATLARMGVEFRLGSDSVTGAHDAAVGPGTGFVLPQAGGAAGAAVRSVAAGRRVAHRVHAYLGGADTTQDEAFSVHAGRLDDGGTVAAMAMGAPYAREEDFDGSGAARQAARCLHCDCRKADTCRLRAYAQQLGANPKRFAGERKSIGYDLSHPAIIFEPNKCIACGICVRIAAEAGEELGLSFSGRGFEVHTAVPFGGTLESGLRKAALACAEACPTGALSPREDPDVP